MTSQWFALRTKPHKESMVYRQLLIDDLEVYYPSISVKPKNPRARKIRPYFPGYMFINLDLAVTGQNVLAWLPGTVGLVGFGDVPAVIPDLLIERLRQTVADFEQKNGINAIHKFNPGDRVRVAEGPFAGYEAIFDRHVSGSDRVQILLAFLSHHPHPIQMPTDSIRKK